MKFNKTDFVFRVSRWLPRQFCDVPLNVNMVSKLASMGIDYDPETGMRTDGEFVDHDD